LLEEGINIMYLNYPLQHQIALKKYKWLLRIALIYLFWSSL
jgi:hypothetical protein